MCVAITLTGMVNYTSQMIDCVGSRHFVLSRAFFNGFDACMQFEAFRHKQRKLIVSLTFLVCKNLATQKLSP